MISKTQTGIRLRIHTPDGREILRNLRRFPLVLGRGSESDVVVDDPNISRRHAEICLIDERFFIRDCKSLNGIRLNGETVLDAALAPGDIVSLGDSRIEVIDLASGEDDHTLDSAEMLIRPREPDSGVLEVIRAIDLQAVLKRQESIADETALNMLAGEESREQYRKLTRAYSSLIQAMDFISRLGSYSHPRQICEQFAAVLRQVFPDVENIFIVDQPAGQERSPKILFRDGDTLRITEVNHPSRTILGRVIQEMRAVYAVDASRDPRFGFSDSVKTRGVRSMMCAPLVARGEVLGGVYVENLTKPYCFDHYDLNLLAVFAFHLAMAMEVCLLLEERDKAFERAATSLQAVKKDKIALLLQYSQSEKKFRALFEQSALGAAVINLVSNRIEEVNDGLVRMLGYSRRQLILMQYSELLEEPATAEEWLLHVRRNGEGSSKTILKTSTGGRIITLQSCRALRVGDSQVMVAYFIDITAKERAEVEIRTQLQRVTALSDLSQGLMSNLDRETAFALLQEKLARVLEVDDLTIALRETEDAPLQVVYEARRIGERSLDGTVTRRPIDGKNQFVRRVLEQREAILYHAGDSHTPNGSAGAVDPFADPPQLHKSALFVPLVSRKQLHGVVCVQCKNPRAYDASHLETLQAMVAQAALALSNARAFEAIREQEESLRQLSLQIMTAQETERSRISRELHDGIGQQLTAMKYLLESVRNAARGGTTDKLLDSVNEARELATQIIQDLRNISLDLRPTMLDDLGLGPTLDWFVRQFESHYGVKVDFRYGADPDILSPEISTTAYRIVQEALGNVAKHARATRAKVDISIENSALVMAIEDDGVGFTTEELHTKQVNQGCSGVLNMKERAHFLGGLFHLESAPGAGTKLKLSIPIKETTH